MIKTALGVQRYNNKMDKIFKEAMAKRRMIVFVCPAVEYSKEKYYVDYTFKEGGKGRLKTDYYELDVESSAIEQMEILQEAVKKGGY
jgi:hypothetical protein